MAFRIPKSVSFRACIYPSPDVKGIFVAHCLELDLIGEGKTPKDAVVELIEAIKLQLEACQSPSQLFFPAPGRVWQKYKQAKNAGRAVKDSSRPDYTPYFESVVATSSVPEQYVTNII